MAVSCAALLIDAALAGVANDGKASKPNAPPLSMSHSSSPSGLGICNRGGMMQSKYAKVSAWKAGVAGASSSSPAGQRQNGSSPFNARNSSFSPSSPSTVDSKKMPALATEAEFLAFNSPQCRKFSTKQSTSLVAASTKAVEVAVRPDPQYLTLTHDPAPSVSFWVPNMHVKPASDDGKPLVETEATINGDITKVSGFISVGTSTEREKPAWKPTASFRDLPINVLERIFQQLRTKRDQACFAMASKRGWFYLIRSLYADIRIGLDADRWNVEAVANMVSLDGDGVPLNPGLRYIRHLEFFGHEELGESGVKRASQLARFLIRSLGITPLEHFSWPSHIPIDADVLWDLWAPLNRQTESVLSDLHLPEEIWSEPNVKGTKDALVRFLTAANRHIEHVAIVAKTIGGLAHVPVLLKKMKRYNGRLISFSLDLLDFSPPMRSGTKNWDGTITEPISETIFGHLPQLRLLQTPQYTCVTKIILKSVNLCLAKTTFLKVFSLDRLQHLELLRCPFANRFLDAASASNPLALHTIKLDHDVDDAANFHESEPEHGLEIMGALRVMVRNFASRLVTLHVRVRGYDRVQLEKQELHFPRLRSLYFHVTCEATWFLREGEHKSHTSVLKDSEKQIELFGTIFHSTCNDVAVTTGGRAWANATQLRDALLGHSSFQSPFLTSVPPKVLTLIISQWTLALLYDNPTQRLIGTAENAPKEDLERIHSASIALNTFAKAERFQSMSDKDAPRSNTASWTRADVQDSQHACPLKVVIVAVEPDETFTLPLALPTTTELTRYSAKWAHNMADRRKTTEARVKRTKPPRRYCFVRGHEVINVDGVDLKKASIVPVTIRELEQLGITIPVYFE